LTLTNGANSFSTVSIKQGILNVDNTVNLGGSSIFIDGGTLGSTGAVVNLTLPNSFVIGPSSGSGTGGLQVTDGNTIEARVITNNGAGTGGLIKRGMGTVELDGSSTYSGPTLIEQGRILLNFDKSVAPTTNLMPSTTAVTMRSAATGDHPTQSYTTIRMEGKSSTATSQTLASTLIDEGAARIIAIDS
jgi:subtilase-type serine protease